MYDQLTLKLDGLLALHLHNTLAHMTLKSVRIAEVLDYEQDSRDRFVALIEGSMIDAVVNDLGTVVAGDAKQFQSFTELWKFAREPHGWVLDEIDHDVALDDIVRLRSVSEVFTPRNRHA